MSSSWFGWVSLVSSLVVASVGCAESDRQTQQPAPTDPEPSESGNGDEDPIEPAAGRGTILVTTIAGEDTTASAQFTKPPVSGYAVPPGDDCVFFEGPVEDTTRYEAQSAGRLTVAAGARSAKLEFVENAGYHAAKLSGGSDPLPLDVPIHVEAAGDDVPAFALSVTPAGLPAITTAPADGVAAGQAFEVAWASTEADFISVHLSAGAGSVRCVAKPSQGKIVVSSDLVAKISGDPTKDVTLTAVAYKDARGRFGDFDVALQYQAHTKPVVLPIL